VSELLSTSSQSVSLPCRLCERRARNRVGRILAGAGRAPDARRPPARSVQLNQNPPMDTTSPDYNADQARPLPYP